MPTAVNVRLIESRDTFQCECEASVVWLCKNFLHEFSIGEGVHDGWNEVATKAVTSREVKHEFFRNKWAIRNTAAAGVAGDVERILLRSGRDVGAIATETSVWIEDSRIVGTC
jgi:hypothetical protein